MQLSPFKGGVMPVLKLGHGQMGEAGERTADPTYSAAAKSSAAESMYC